MSREFRCDALDTPQAYISNKKCPLRNALLIQHCYIPYGTTQLEKTIKNRQKGPFLALKCPLFGSVGVPDDPNGVPANPITPIHQHFADWDVKRAYLVILGP